MRIIDDFLPNPEWYRRMCLIRQFEDVDGFRGISVVGPNNQARVFLDDLIHERLNFTAHVNFSFLRKSPLGQIEPNDIHNDGGMGDWTGILYLNPSTPDGDGTTFWAHKETAATTGPEDTWRADGHDRRKWMEVAHVEALFNRLLLFPADRFHSRSLVENYGQGDDARLIQVMFGRGEIQWQ